MRRRVRIEVRAVAKQPRTVALLRRRAAKLPSPAKKAIRRAGRFAPARLRGRLGLPARQRVRWGNLRRTSPFDRRWGLGRGTPVDRVYIESFLERQATDVAGRCLEVMNRDYTERFGHEAVELSDVLDLDTTNELATVIADLGVPESLPESRYDCFIFTQTLHLVPDMRIALANCWRALRPGGVLLVTVPTLGVHVTAEGFEHDRWRVTPSGMRWMLGELHGAESEVTAYGNVLACAALLYGISAEEMSRRDLEDHDEEFPLIVAARVRKPPEP